MYSFPYLEPVHCSMSSSSCCFLTCIQVLQEAVKVVWYFHLLNNFSQFAVIHTIKYFSIVNETEVDTFLEFFCFFYDLMDAGSLISGSSVFYKRSLNIWQFSDHILLKPSLMDFEHYLANVKWVQLWSSLNILWHRLSLGLEWKLTFFSSVATAEFSKCAVILSAAF